ncbi:MAG: DUF1801 domain-containing protein [Parasphingopyxis sp.]|nr:DUF1801 domain-containing protein [Sphingomonadales bacterium]
MAENKTQQTDESVAKFLEAVEPEQKREDAKAVCAMMERLSGHPPKMWGPAIVGFGSYHYKYDSGREGDFLLTGFSPRKSAISLYIMDGYQDRGEILSRLGKYKTGKSCLYVNKLSDIDLEVLEELILDSLAYMRATYDTT